MSLSFDIKATGARLLEETPAPLSMQLRVGRSAITLRTNSPELLEALQDYFRHLLVERDEPHFELIALERSEPDLGLHFVDWPRDEGKEGRKDSYVDIPGGRVVRKVRTGMQFLLEADRAVAVGACHKNANQIINLVNSQYLSRLVRSGYLVCHSAAVMKGSAGLGLSGVSGAGKSTLALRLISRGLTYVSNDRLLVRKESDCIHMAGVPKMPRINPGTILGNPDLWPILGEDRLKEVQAMPRQELWELEEKYDADIERLYGPNRIAMDGVLNAFVVLTWSPKTDAPMEVFRGKLSDRPDLMPAITKHAGVFHSDPERGAVPPPMGPPDATPYLEQMGDLPLLCFSGGVDFEAGADACEALLDEFA